jgi:hypothetical protein
MLRFAINLSQKSFIGAFPSHGRAPIKLFWLFCVLNPIFKNLFFCLPDFWGGITMF